MKKFLLCVLAGFIGFGQSPACGGYDPDYEYYNLFIQEVIDDPQYYPFLLTYGVGYYSPYDKEDVGKNENIEEWQDYLGASYEDTYYLVFKASRDDVRSLIAGKSVSDSSLKFVTPAFVTKHKQALLYLAYAKYLEPYMTITQSHSDWGYYYSDPEFTADKLDYEKVINVLEKSWKAETDKELKLRYGYQLVRFAHYNRNYSEAIRYFNTYVEPLNYKKAMYYYALNQKAGAQRGIGEVIDANYNFFKVFTNSKDLKENALSSIKFTENVDYKKFLERAKTANEINDAYLLLGYISFSNPLAALEKIVSTTPDATQAKVLMARAINIIERYYNPTGYYCWEGTCFDKADDRRYPIVRDKDKGEIQVFFNQSLTLSQKMANQPSTKDKNFWNLTSAYLNFLKKDFVNAKSYLSKVEVTNAKYKKQKDYLSMYIDISEHPQITNDLENQFYSKYKDIFNTESYSRWAYYGNGNFNLLQYNTKNFVIDVLANRYFIQKDYGKSFLLNNSILALEENPRLDLLADIENLYNKSNKNDMEKYILQNIYPMLNDTTRMTAKQFDVQGYIDYMRGNIYLAQGNLEKSLESFKKIKPGFTVYRASWDGSITLEGKSQSGGETGYKGFDGVSSRVFGYNRIECFECEDSYIMGEDYLSDFPFIKSKMNKRELVEALVQLKKAGEKNNEQGAKANYLIGNFFYNVTSTGFYRHLLRFDQNNSICEKYRINTEKDIYDNIYFKYYPTYFANNVSLPQQYLEKSYTQAKDNELRARIAFALSKCEQEANYDANKFDSPWSFNDKGDGILIKDRKYFAELQKYKETEFYEEVRTNCMYFNYYVNHY